jgi:hypothetical protein
MAVLAISFSDATQTACAKNWTPFLGARESFFRQDVRRFYVLRFADAWRGWHLKKHDVATPALQRCN